MAISALATATVSAGESKSPFLRKGRNLTRCRSLGRRSAARALGEASALRGDALPGTLDALGLRDHRGPLHGGPGDDQPLHSARLGL